MFFLFSGEGPTDMGTGKRNDCICMGVNYEHGPMALFVAQIVTHQQGYSPVKKNYCGFIPKKALMKKAKPKSPDKKGMLLPGNKREKETGYFYRTAVVFGIWAKKEQKKRGEKVVAVLFRDSDSQQRTVWLNKWQSIQDGFQRATYDFGVPMLPKPTSEAWLLCALKDNPYQNCNKLEKRSSSPKAKKPLKKELEERCGCEVTRDALCTLIENKKIDAAKIDMPSFNAFKTRLLEVIQ